MAFRRRHRAGLTCAALGALALLAADPAPAQPASGAHAAIEGIEDAALLARLKDVLAKARDGAPETLGAARRAAREEADLLAAALKAEGYYAGEVAADIEPRESGAPRILFHVRPGARFRIAGYDIVYVDAIADARPATLEEAGLAPDGSPRGEDLRKLGTDFLDRLHAGGFPRARLVDLTVEARFAEAEARIVYRCETGPRALYGQIEIDGLERTKYALIDAQRTWKRGQPVDLEQLTAFRDALVDLELFSVVTVEPGVPGPDGLTPILVAVTERPARTVSLGASYSTNFGAGTQASWVHRNLFGGAERLRVEAKVAEIRQSLGAGFSLPWARIHGRLGLRAAYEREDSDAYASDSFTAGVDVDSRLARHLRGSLGLELEASDSDDPLGAGSAYLLAAPATLSYDTSDDVLDPREGLRAQISLAPHFGSSDGEAVVFLKSDARASYYRPFDEAKRYVAAVWAHAGSLVGADLALVPATRRFYAGGGGSVRAYGYQLIGPIDASGEPTGARSVVEGGVELRAMVTRTVGAAAFLEAGTASESTFPDLSEDVLSGGGLGLRYLSPVGPIRLDVAVPFDRRRIDDGFQIYVSLGQAF
ncbi:MAG: outer membrane protein assembly factor [Alphaproteobacteria bacterium]|nr:outer membrane protein assembly factor [Alphaproteobacteria bacterium]